MVSYDYDMKSDLLILYFSTASYLFAILKQCNKTKNARIIMHTCE